MGVNVGFLFLVLLLVGVVLSGVRVSLVWVSLFLRGWSILRGGDRVGPILIRDLYPIRIGECCCLLSRSSRLLAADFGIH